ncbi:MAG: NAD-dependent DNA ligase LigA [Endomicrobium sp.]|jgi:DNA ligase (NAD+)|nr:NAD-dependent DNA ligase LigA [Endomicrobium sp.]
MESVQNRIDYLIKELARHNNLYYDKNSPEVSDSEYDNLVKELRKLEIENPLLVSPKSPTQEVSGFASPIFENVTHLSRMLSLDNTYSLDETTRWYERVEKNLKSQNIEFIVEPKVDGVSASLTYFDGILAVAATRGNGYIGENITENIKTIKNIPLMLKIKNPPKFFELRGEVYINKSDFEKLNEEILAVGGLKFANPRNAASGSLRQKNPQITAARKLRFFVHSLGSIDGIHLQKQSDFLKYCQECNFQLQNDFKICSSLNEITDFINVMLNKRDFLQYEIDGLVIKVNHVQLQNDLGYTSKSPRWAIAFKFPAKQTTTVLEKISTQVGRTGIITPLAILRPVALAGVTISRATLHNFEEIQRLNVNEGDTVLIERSGDVIPKIVKVVKKGTMHHNSGFFKPLRNCPSCGGEIIKENENEVAYRCINPECPAQFKRYLIHFASRNAMDIDGFGEAVIDQLIEKGKIRTLADIYSLTYDDFVSLNLFKEKKANNLVKAITASKSQPLSRLLFALGIRHVGEKASELIAKRFKNLETLLNISAEDFTKIYGIGEVLSLSLKGFFENMAARRVVNALIAAGLNTTEPETEQASTFLEGKIFVLTGELENYTREQVSAIIRSLGGKVTSAISKKTNYVLAGSKAGSKFDKAKRLNIKIIDEKEFRKLTEI